MMHVEDKTITLNLAKTIGVLVAVMFGLIVVSNLIG